MSKVESEVRSKFAVIAAQLLAEVRDQIESSPDMLGRFANNKSASDHWSGNLDGNKTNGAYRWIKAKALHQDVEAALEQAKEELLQSVIPVFADKLYNERMKPSNPCVEVMAGNNLAHRFQIWMTSTFTTHFGKKTVDDHLEIGYVQELVNAGLPVAAATSLVQQELKLVQLRGMRDLTELSTGFFNKAGDWLSSSEAEKRAAEKFEAWLNWDGKTSAPEPLSDAEKEAAFVRKNVVVVRPGFLDRVHQYARSPQDILAIFQCIKPSIFPTRLEFGLNEDEDGKKLQKLEFSVEILR